MPANYSPRDVTGHQMPDGLIINVPSTNLILLKALADKAVGLVKEEMPKSSGAAAGGVSPVFGPGWFGVRWSHPYVWYQDQGIGPYTMRSLKGKVIPMWVEDESGEEARKIPARDRVRRTRRTVDGRTQVLIFRKATNPGAPGRIGKMTRRPDGRIARGNVGVKWRHPGLPKRGFLSEALSESLRSVKGVSAHGDVRPVSLRAR